MAARKPVVIVGGELQQLQAGDTVDGGKPPTMTVLTSGTTYTPPAGAKALRVECIGGGGGGGGAVASASNASVASGGGGGGYAAEYIAGPLKASYTYAIGAGGVGSIPGSIVATAGGSTTFDSPSVCTANGGQAGSNMTGGTTQAIVGRGPGGTATVGDVLIAGGDGNLGWRISGTSGMPGFGGAAARGGGIVSTFGGGNQGAGVSGNPPGGGGSGAFSLTATGFNGGAGRDGMIIVTEFY